MHGGKQESKSDAMLKRRAGHLLLTLFPFNQLSETYSSEREAYRPRKGPHDIVYSAHVTLQAQHSTGMNSLYEISQGFKRCLVSS